MHECECTSERASKRMCALCKYLSRAQEGKEKKTQERKQISIIRYELYGLLFSREKHGAKRGNLKLRDWIKCWDFPKLLEGNLRSALTDELWEDCNSIRRRTTKLKAVLLRGNHFSGTI
uniref:(northern house mosquito) hypothetical protein n=1 Tax=Culex pipiens TaxID=7175 RepID=A0A8D8HUP6_CULPI